MYDVLVLNNKFETVGIIDYYISLIWTERYSECGDFELTLKSDSSVFSFIGVGYYLWIKGANMMMIIEKIEVQTDVEDGNGLILSGRSLESLLDRRIIWPQTNLDCSGYVTYTPKAEDVVVSYNSVSNFPSEGETSKCYKANDTNIVYRWDGKLQHAIKQLITDCFINPTWDAESRKVNNFRFIDADDSNVTSLDLKAQYTGDSLYDVISAICAAYDLGFFVRFNDDEKTFEFGLYKGEDRSYDQEDLSYVVFSSKYDNLISSNYLESDENLKTLTIVAGEGEGIERITQTVISSSGTGYGIGRRELFTDAKDISRKTNSVNEMSETAYKLALRQKGLEELASCVSVLSFEGEVENGQTFSYDVDYHMGDIVQLRDEYEKEGSVRVTELIRSIDSSGFEVYPTFVTVYKATISITGNIGDTIIVSGTGYGYDIIVTSSAPIEIVITKTGSFSFYGRITGITRSIGAETNVKEYSADLRFNANLNIVTNLGATLHFLSAFDSSYIVYKSTGQKFENFPEEGDESKTYLAKDTMKLYEWKRATGTSTYNYIEVKKVAESGYSYWDWGNDFISLYYTSNANGSTGIASLSVYREGLYSLLSSLGPDDDQDNSITLSTLPESKASINPDALGETFNGKLVYVWTLGSFGIENVKDKKILKYSTYNAFPGNPGYAGYAEPQTSKWYYDKTAEKYYSWNGTAYVEVSDVDKPNGDGDYQTRDVQIYFADPSDQVDDPNASEYIKSKEQTWTKYYTGTIVYVSEYDYPTEPSTSKYGNPVGDGEGTYTVITPDIGYKRAFDYKNLVINKEYKFSAWPYVTINGTRYYGSKSTTSVKITITAISISIKQQPEGSMDCLIYWDKPKTLYSGVEIYYSTVMYPNERNSSKFEPVRPVNTGVGNLVDMNAIGKDETIEDKYNNYYDGWITVDDDEKESSSSSSSQSSTDYKYTFNWTIPEDKKEETFYFSTWTYYDVDGTRYYSESPSKYQFEWQAKKDDGGSGSGSGDDSGGGYYDDWVSIDDDNG